MASHGLDKCNWQVYGLPVSTLASASLHPRSPSLPRLPELKEKLSNIQIQIARRAGAIKAMAHQHLVSPVA
jgi:hypothetical protein